MQTKKSSATIIAFIVLLLTLGGAAVYFKNFPLEKLPTGEPTEQRGMVVTSTIQSELEICREMTKKYKEERDKFLGEYNSYSKAEIGIMPTEEKDALEQRFLGLEKKVNEWDKKCRNALHPAQKTEEAITSNIEIDVIPSPTNLFPPSPVNFGLDFDKNYQLIPISLKFFSKSRLEIFEGLWEDLNWRWYYRF